MIDFFCILRVFNKIDPHKEGPISYDPGRVGGRSCTHWKALIESFPMTPISSINTAYLEKYDNFLVSSPVLSIFNTGFGVRFPQHKPPFATLINK